MAVALQMDYDAVRVRQAARSVKDGSQARRLLSIAAVYEGKPWSEAASLGGMDRQTLRDWIHRFNAEGTDGMANRKASGAPRKLTAAQMSELARIVETVPDVGRDGVVRWQRVGLRDVIERRFGVAYHERSVSRLLHELGFSHMSVRPHHPKQDAEAVETYKNGFAQALPTESRPCRTGPGSSSGGRMNAPWPEKRNGAPVGTHGHTTAPITRPMLPQCLSVRRHLPRRPRKSSCSTVLPTPPMS